MKTGFLASVLALAAVQTAAQTATAPTALGQQLYLPIYSHIWHGDSDRDGQAAKTLVSVAVSIRNTDASRPIRVTSAQYFDTDGKKLREYLPVPKVIGPMGTYEIFVPRSDDTGGSGANFVIRWKADKPTSVPLVQAVHANLPAGRAIVFTTSAVEIAGD